MRIGNKKIKVGVFLTGLSGLVVSLWLMFGPGIEDIPIGKLGQDSIKEMNDAGIGETKLDDAEAVQTYPTTSSSTGHQTDHLTNNVQRDDALRSCFSGTTAPASPVEGQCWYDETNNVEKRYDGAAWIEQVDLGSTQTLTNKTLTAPVLGGTSTGTYTLSGSVTYGSTKSCSSGYTRVGIMCLDTDGTLADLHVTSTDEGSYTARTVDSNAKAAILHIIVSNTAGTGSPFVRACTLPGDSSVTQCTAIEINGYARVGESDHNFSMFTIATNGSGQVKTRCVIQGTSPSGSCSFRIAGYID